MPPLQRASAVLLGDPSSASHAAARAAASARRLASVGACRCSRRCRCSSRLCWRPAASCRAAARMLQATAYREDSWLGKAGQDSRALFEPCWTGGGECRPENMPTRCHFETAGCYRLLPHLLMAWRRSGPWAHRASSTCCQLAPSTGSPRQRHARRRSACSRAILASRAGAECVIATSVYVCRHATCSTDVKGTLRTSHA